MVRYTERLDGRFSVDGSLHKASVRNGLVVERMKASGLRAVVASSIDRSAQRDVGETYHLQNDALQIRVKTQKARRRERERHLAKVQVAMRLAARPTQTLWRGALVRMSGILAIMRREGAALAIQCAIRIELSVLTLMRRRMDRFHTRERQQKAVALLREHAVLARKMRLEAEIAVAKCQMESHLISLFMTETFDVVFQKARREWASALKIGSAIRQSLATKRVAEMRFNKQRSAEIRQLTRLAVLLAKRQDMYARRIQAGAMEWLVRHRPKKRSKRHNELAKRVKENRLKKKQEWSNVLDSKKFQLSLTQAVKRRWTKQLMDAEERRQALIEALDEAVKVAHDSMIAAGVARKAAAKRVTYLAFCRKTFFEWLSRMAKISRGGKGATKPVERTSRERETTEEAARRVFAVEAMARRIRVRATGLSALRERLAVEEALRGREEKRVAEERYVAGVVADEAMEWAWETSRDRRKRAQRDASRMLRHQREETANRQLKDRKFADKALVHSMRRACRERIAQKKAVPLFLPPIEDDDDDFEYDDNATVEEGGVVVSGRRPLTGSSSVARMRDALAWSHSYDHISRDALL